jgi:D-cysteine desulfhydrase
MRASTAPTPPLAPDLALERRFPGFTERLPRYRLTDLPTPVHRLARLGVEGGIPDLWVKRDDASGRLYGGNKPRKLEWLLGDARRRGRRSVMTFGGIGTHHGLATAVCARQAGLRTILVLLPQPVSDHVRRCLLLDRAYGAELHVAPSVAAVVATAAGLLARGAVRGDVPAIIPAGGTSPLGTLGYVNAALEFAEQVRAGSCPEPDSIFVPLGSGATVTGLVLGLKLAGLRSRVVGVLVTDILPPSASRLARLANRCWKRLDDAAPEAPRVQVEAGDFSIVGGFVGPGYGAPTEEAVRAVDSMRGLEGISLETTYTGKCLAALLRLAAEEYRGQTLLFWNTYSSVDPARDLPYLPDFRELPAAFHRFFT